MSLQDDIMDYPCGCQRRQSYPEYTGSGPLEDSTIRYFYCQKHKAQVEANEKELQQLREQISDMEEALKNLETEHNSLYDELNNDWLVMRGLKKARKTFKII